MIWAIAGGALFLLAYWYRLLIFSQIPFDGNTIRLCYPSWVIGKEMLLNGFSLLWDPYRNLGQPFLADPINQALYPIRLLSPFVNYLTYQRFFVVFHTLLAAAPAALIAKRFAKDDDPSIVAFAALAAGFNGLMLARVTLAPHYAALAWAPCVLYFLMARRPTFLALALAGQWMAGFPPLFILTLVTLVAAVLITETRKESLQCLGYGAVLAAGLTAVQWIPFLELLKESARGVLLSSGQATEFSLHPLELLRQLVIPAFFHNRFTPVSSSDTAITGFYLGPVTLGLALWAAIKGGRTGRWLAAAAVLAFFLALGDHSGIYRFIPLITVFRFPANWLLPATIALASAAVVGLMAVPHRNLRWILFGLAAVDLLCYALPMRTPWGGLSFFSEMPARVAGLDNASRGTRVFHTASIVDNASAWRLDSERAWLTMRGTLVPSIGAAYGIEEVSSYNVLISQRHLNFLRRLNQAPADSPLFDAASINKIVLTTNTTGTPAWSDIVVRDNTDPNPRIFLADDGTIVASQAYYPGWRVAVKGHEQPVGIFEQEFLNTAGVPNAAEEHFSDVRFFYSPNSFRWGLALSLFTSVIGVALFVRYKR